MFKHSACKRLGSSSQAHHGPVTKRKAPALRSPCGTRAGLCSPASPSRQGNYREVTAERGVCLGRQGSHGPAALVAKPMATLVSPLARPRRGIISFRKKKPDLECLSPHLLAGWWDWIQGCWRLQAKVTNRAQTLPE